MPHKYHIDLPNHKVFRILKNQIEKSGENTLSGHFKYAHGANQRVQLMGEIKGDEFAFWATLHPGNLFSGIYPVVYVSISDTDPTTLLFKSKWSALGKLKLLVLYGLLFVLLIFGVIIQDDNTLPYLINRLVLVMAILGFLMTPPLYFYRLKARTLRKALLKKLTE